MLSWLSRLAGSFVSVIPTPIRQLVHWATHAIAAVMVGVFGHVLNAWRGLVRDTVSLGHEIEDFAHWVADRIRVMLKYWVPRILNYAATLYHEALARLDQLRHWAAAELDAVRAWVKALAAALWHDVLKYVYDPLFAAVTWARKYLLLWGYTAWWWVTHLADLAEALYLHLIHSLEVHAWEIAPALGRFLTALIVGNARRFVLLLEDIFTAVL